MRLAYAAFVDTAKWQMAVKVVNKSLVNNACSCAYMLQEVTHCFFVFTKYVHRQRIAMCYDIGRKFLQVSKGFNR